MRTARAAVAAAGRRAAPARTTLPHRQSPSAHTGASRSCVCGGGCPRCTSATGSSADAHEREADEVANQVMRMNAPARATDPAPSQHAAAGQGQGGTPLPNAVRAYFEPRFRADFSRVRVHADGESADAAADLRARAYTVRDDMVFGDGEYAPHTASGRWRHGAETAHEPAHVIQQSEGRAPAAPQRKEVPDDKDISGKQDWTTADREKNTQRWQDACLTNLKAADSSQYRRIVERRDFYKWFYEYTASQGFTTRWALAASVVANGAHQIADIDSECLNELANEQLGLANVELRGYMREGNQVIFDNVMPKLKKLVDGGPLKGAAALNWDMQVLAEEQTLIQPLYTKMSKDTLQQLDDLARKSGIAGAGASFMDQDKVAAMPHSKAGTVPEFSGSDIKDIGERWKYGMTLGNVFTPGGSGYKQGTTIMPGVSADYSSGAEFSKLATRSTLHQLDAWLTSDPATRVGSGKDIDSIIGKLTESEKQQIVSSRGPGDMHYAELFAAATSVPRATVAKAMPTDPKFASAVAQFWKDYDAAKRGFLDSWKDLADTGET